MSLAACVPGMVEKGELTREQGDRLMSMYDEMLSANRANMGEAAAATRASEQVLDQLQRDAALKERRTGLTIAARHRMLADLHAGTRDGEPLSPKRAERQLHHAEDRRLAIRSRSFAMLNGVLEQFHSNAIGMVRHKAELRDLVRELFGENSGKPAARELADAWTRTAEMLRQRFNAAGGDIGKMEKWGLPQSHDTRAVQNAGYEGWRDFIKPLLDRMAMQDEATGLPMTGAKLEASLHEVWQSISTDGWNGRSAGSSGRGAIASRRSDSRFLHFKDADSWAAYQERFGAANAFDAMMNHVNGMSRDIGLMEVLGPNPNASIDWLKQTVIKAGNEDVRPKNRSAERSYAASKQIDRLYAEITGANGRPENRTIALGFSFFRAVQTAAKLGGAVLKKPVEFATAYMTRLNNGVATWSMLPQFVQAIRPMHDEAFLIRATGIAEEASSRIASTGQTLGETLTGGIAQRMAASTVRLSGLGRFTEANRWMAGMGYISELTGNAKRSFDELRPAFRRSLERQGIDGAGWDSIRKTPLEQQKGAGWLLPHNVEDHALGDKLYGAIHHMVDNSVPAPGLAVRTWINSNAPSGTWRGELIRSMGQFKAFPISIVAQHLAVIMEHYTAGRTWHAASYAGGLFMTTTLMGALTLELEALKRGEDPRNMLDPPHEEEGKDGEQHLNLGFWPAASLQGGGWGLFGDFIHSSENHFGGGIAGSIVGPAISDAANLAQAATSKNPAWALARAGIADLPGQSLWYTRLAFQRLVADQAQSLLDPHYSNSWARIEKRARDENSAVWWRPGEVAPERGPNLAAAVAAPASKADGQPFSEFAAR